MLNIFELVKFVITKHTQILKKYYLLPIKLWNGVKEVPIQDQIM